MAKTPPAPYQATLDAIGKERAEQIEKHGHTIEGDVEKNKNGQLRDAAILLISSGQEKIEPGHIAFDNPPFGWEREVWEKMWSKPLAERVIVAAALLAAEHDRLVNS